MLSFAKDFVQLISPPKKTPEFTDNTTTKSQLIDPNQSPLSRPNSANHYQKTKKRKKTESQKDKIGERNKMFSLPPSFRIPENPSAGR